ncbi:hypothetical protein E2C01_026123 [Portunus trituberculatus]|uniref:Uncharacterized protein n=1 Tax=Portunus trituberculatus TaxID=210409 RepID=A0A5B7EIB3_PORTR|nr:hypothetical protein [Portunus trituberculatus]
MEVRSEMFQIGPLVQPCGERTLRRILPHSSAPLDVTAQQQQQQQAHFISPSTCARPAPLRPAPSLCDTPGAGPQLAPTAGRWAGCHNSLSKAVLGPFNCT